MKWNKIVEGDESTLPRVGQEVLIISEEGCMSVERRLPLALSIYADATDSGYATHWMELPDAPDED